MTWILSGLLAVASFIILYLFYQLKSRPSTSILKSDHLFPVLHATGDYSDNPMMLLDATTGHLLYSNKPYKGLIDLYRHEDRGNQDRFPILLLSEGRVESLFDYMMLHKQEIVQKHHHAEKLFLFDKMDALSDLRDR